MRLVGWLLAFVLALGAAGFLLVAPSDARAQSRAVDAGTAETIPARLHAVLDTHTSSRKGKSDRNGSDEWIATCQPTGKEVDVPDDEGFDVRGRGEILHEWEGAAVSCYLWPDGKVIAIKGPHGTIVKSEDIGWRGAISRWNAGAFALGVALLIGGTTLRMGTWTAIAGGALVAAAVMVALHLAWLWVGLAADVLLLLGLGWLLVRASRGVEEPAGG
jgi:hypothetical protein